MVVINMLKNNFKINKLSTLSMLLTLPFILIVGLRGGTPDTQVYYNVFLSIKTLPIFNPIDFYLQSGMEIGFGIYAYLICLFTNSSFVLFSLFSLLNFVFIYKSASILNVKYYFVFVVYVSSSYFFMQQFMQMRQGLAISIIFFAAVHYLKFKRITPFILLVLLACSFHQSAFVFFIFIIIFSIFNGIPYFKGKRFSIFSLSLAFVLILLFKFIIIDFVIGMSSRLQSYSQVSNYSESIGIVNLPMLRTCIILMFALLIASNTLWSNVFFRLVFFIQAIALSTRIGFSDFAILSGRLSTVFSYVEIFLLPMVILSRFSLGLSIFFCIIILFIQLVASLIFQAPYLFDMYFIPLYI